MTQCRNTTHTFGAFKQDHLIDKCANVFVLLYKLKDVNYYLRYIYQDCMYNMVL